MDGDSGCPKCPTVCSDWLQACKEGSVERKGRAAEGSPAVVHLLELQKWSHKSLSEEPRTYRKKHLKQDKGMRGLFIINKTK